MYLKNNVITLRALEPEDLDILYRWENDTRVWNVSLALEPYSRYIIKEYIAYSDKTIFEKRQLRLMIARNSDGVAVGTIDLYDFDPFHSRAGVGVLIDFDHQSQGYARQALALLKEYAFKFLHIHNLYAQIPTDNEASVRLFSSAGFVHCGTLRDWIRTEDRYVDVLQYSLLNADE